MHSIELDVLERVAHWCERGERPWLCTIVRTIGSSPRPPGSLLACLDNGEVTGSLSGGCVEEDLLQKLAAGAIDDSAPQVVEYGVTAEENERLGLPCGGRLLVLVQRLDAAELAWINPVLEALARRECTLRSLDIASGTTTLQPVPHHEPLAYSETTLRQCFGPQMRMLLVGAGQLSQTLSELALAMGYEVLVTDTRQHALDQWLGPDVPLIQGMPDDVVLERAADNHSIVITLTHDPRIDDMALMEALSTDAWYVGALGSARTTEKRLRRLADLGVPAQAIARLHAPVGLPIGSKTPHEIAVAIMAQITQMRRAH
ncbi:XdhC family protein [Mangrovimicrobium sediminis]|uniref:XdhC family protein n=1 Tax=Mangrovimicrobium sediminis TaxID=2562682 RepID=A0A4Z0M6E0_9GAMM|nr:XdhC family protein [Haliea sp. SAOS-164]TGD75242.1 XdhC family protein [Haliea sp. SAOS-164]